MRNDVVTLALPVEITGRFPGHDPMAGDILLPPDTLQIDGYVRLEHIGCGRIRMLSVSPEARWAQAEPLYQVERAEETGGYRLRQLPPGGIHGISIQALRRIRGHGLTVAPSEAFGLLIGWPEHREVLAALPVGRTHVYHQRSDLFDGIERALAPARDLAASRGLGVMGLYCASRCRDVWDIGFRVPPCLSDDYLLMAPGFGNAWSQNILKRSAPPHGRQTCPWRLSHRRIETAAMNPRRMHTAWLRIVGLMDYGRCEAPAPGATDSPPTPAATAERDWFSAARLPIDAADVPPAWQWLAEAIAAAAEVRIRYAGGTAPGVERTIRPVALFRVAGYDATYVQAVDTELDEERVFRLDRMTAGLP